MAVRLDRFFATTCLRRSFSTLSRPLIMAHCRIPQNLPGNFLPYPPVAKGGGNRKYIQLKTRTFGKGCRSSVDQLNGSKLGFEQDSRFYRRLYSGNRHEVTINHQFQSKLVLLNTMRPRTILSSRSFLAGSGVMLKPLSYEGPSRRYFSFKGTRGAQMKGEKHSQKGNSSLKVIHGTQKQAKPLSVQISPGEGLRPVDLIQSAGMGFEESSKLAIKTENAAKPGGKTGDPIQTAQSKVKKKQQPERKVHDKQLPVTSAASGAAKARGSSKTSRKKKPNATDAFQTSQITVEEILPAMEIPDSVTHNQSKKTPVPSSKKRTSRRKTTLMKSDGVLTKRSKSVVTERSKDGTLVEDKSKAQLEKLGPLYPPLGKTIVVVESLTKAKVIQNYLGDMFEVLPSYGHVRDLAGRSGSVRPDDDFSMVWEVPASAWTHLKSIKVALNGARYLILASDPDREGEAIAWHITEMLLQQDALHKDLTVARVVFHEITESSIKTALQSPRDINANLVHAYLARRALDYLIGFSISPLLWRKLPGCQSAGRVQSVALALICDRELEIEKFKPKEYWTVEAEFKSMQLNSSNRAAPSPFLSYMTHLEAKKLEKFSITSHEKAKVVEEKLISSKFEVVGVKESQLHRNAHAPYITSTLQQDAANKLHFNSSYTMKLAQKLYEGVKLSNDEATGLITYMRTDGLHVSNEAVKEIKLLITNRYGESFVSNLTKHFKKVKNAQEAHEAIRPTSIRRLPSNLVGILDEDSLKLYSLIWARTVSSQMAPATVDQIQVNFGTAEGTMLRSTASKISFFGYQAVYKDKEFLLVGQNVNEEISQEEAFTDLFRLQPGVEVHLEKVEVKQHHTQPPPRYSEGALVKKLEELGIGRPSTYASIMKVLQDRSYVTMKSRVLFPEFRGRMVSAFLSDHFSEVTNYSFTADLENELDNVSVGKTEWRVLLKDYWSRFSMYCDQAGKVHIRQVEKMLEERFGDFLFASLPDKNRTCPSCQEGMLIFKVSRFGVGYFIGCDKHPKCKYIASTILNDDDETATSQIPDKSNEPKLLGLNPGSEEKIYLKNGPYGFYVQLGGDRKGYLPKRVPIHLVAKGSESVTLEDALELLKYPITLGNHPEDGHPIVLKVSRIGFSLRHRSTMATVPKNISPQTITVEKAIKLLSSKDARQIGRPKGKPRVEEAVDALFS